MTDSIKKASTASIEQTVTPITSEAAEATQNKGSQSGSTGKGLGLLALSLSLLSLTGVGFIWYQTQVASVAANTQLVVGVTGIKGDIKRLDDAIVRQQDQQALMVTQEQLTTRILESNNSVSNQIRNIKDEQTTLVGSVEKINSDLQKGINQFVIDEVSQLLKLANNSAIFSGDAYASIRALQLADIQLKELADPRFSLVRRTVNEEIALLESVEQVDIESVSVRLNAIAKKVPLLPLENEPPTKESVKFAEEPVATQEVTWRTEVGKMWKDILNSVQVQRVDQPPKPLLAPQQRYFLNQNLQLNLAKAELALLQDRQGVYTRSIESSVSWLSDYFDLEDSEVKSVLVELAELKALPVGFKLPPVTESYDRLQSIKGGL